MIVIVDYGLGNLRTIQYKLKYLNRESIISCAPESIISARCLILPGVGSFASGMKNIHARMLLDALEEAVFRNRTPILGICLGMQLFSNHSEEGDVAGFGWIPGTVKKLTSSVIGADLRIPHVGWNTVNVTQSSPLTEKLNPRSRFYFTHSYYMECALKTDIVGETEYGIQFPSIIRRDNVMGTQFHPEKSHSYGMAVIESFLEYSKC